MWDENVYCMLQISVAVGPAKTHNFKCFLVHVYADHIYWCLSSHLQLHISMYRRMKYNIYIFHNIHYGSHTLLAVGSFSWLAVRSSILFPKSYLGAANPIH